MKRMNQPFANTSVIIAKLDELEKFRDNNWEDFNGNGNTFIALQDMLSPEREYLKSFWHRKENGDEDYVMDEKFIPWNCLRAFDDLPQDLQDFVLNRGCYKGYFAGYNKYDVFHRREEYLEEIQDRIFDYFHEWQFCTQGWTAY